jgi:hypothetical protein
MTPPLNPTQERFLSELFSLCDRYKLDGRVEASSIGSALGADLFTVVIRVRRSYPCCSLPSLNRSKESPHEIKILGSARSSS